LRQKSKTKRLRRIGSAFSLFKVLLNLAIVFRRRRSLSAPRAIREPPHLCHSLRVFPGSLFPPESRIFRSKPWSGKNNMMFKQSPIK
jgi:hypothetical protein